MAAAPSFRLAGIPVRVEPVFFVIVALLGLGQEPRFVVSWVVIAFASILLHELGHAVAFRAYGIQPSIVLTGFGGVTSGRGELTPGRSIVVSLAGPLSGLVLVGLPALWAEAAGLVEGDDARVVLAQVVWITIGWSLLNLLPMLPLDGGAVTASVLELLRPGRGRRLAAWVSVVVAGAAAVAAAVYGLLFGVLLAAWFLAANVGELGADRRRAVGGDLRTAEQALVAGQPHVAEQRARRVLAGRASPADGARARQLLAWARLVQGDVAGATEAATPRDRRGRPLPGGPAGGGLAGDQLPSTGPGPSLRSALALAGGRRAEGATTAAWALVHDPDPLGRALLGVLVARAGVLDEVVSGLLAVGPEGGWQAAFALRDVLGATGHGDAAGQVSLRLARDGRQDPPRGPAGWADG